MVWEPLNSDISKVPSCCGILWCLWDSKQNEQRDPTGWSFSKTSPHTSEAGQPFTMGNKLRESIPPRSAAGGTQKLIPNNFGQIYESQSHPREQGGPPCLEGCGSNRIPAGWIMGLTWDGKSSIPMESTLERIPALDLSISSCWKWKQNFVHRNHLRLIYVHWVGKILVPLLRNSP